MALQLHSHADLNNKRPKHELGSSVLIDLKINLQSKYYQLPLDSSGKNIRILLLLILLV